MEKEIVKINFEEIKNLLKNPSNYSNDAIYVITLLNCNGITTELLNFLESLSLNIKFKIDRDLFNFNVDDALNKGKFTCEYNYNIEQMKKIISYFEEVVNAMPKMNDFGKFLFIYAIVCSEINYDKSKGFDFENQFELASLQRSLYGNLINGEGVCVGYSLVLYNLLSYVNVNCKMLSGKAFLSNGKSGEHAWNAVCIDEVWYYVDATWDSNDLVNLKNCLVVNDSFLKSHQLNNESLKLMKDYKIADKDYDSSFIKQCFAHLCDKYILQNNLIQKLRSYRIPKKNFYTTDNYQEDSLNGSWKDILDGFDFDGGIKK